MDYNTSEMIYKTHRAKNSSYELRTLMEDYLSCKNEENKMAYLKKIKKLIP